MTTLPVSPTQEISEPEFIYKICPRQEWERNKKGYLGNPRDQADGFLHSSLSHQVERIFMKYYAAETDHILLQIVYAKVVEKIKWEPNSTGDLFPHIYRPLTEGDVFLIRELPEALHHLTSL